MGVGDDVYWWDWLGWMDTSFVRENLSKEGQEEGCNEILMEPRATRGKNGNKNRPRS